MNRKTLSWLLFLFATGNLPAQEITGSVNDEGFVVLSGDAVELFGIDLISAGGFLIPIEHGDPRPFGFFLENSPTQITYANLGDPLIVAGELVLSARYTKAEDAAGDLTGEWGGPVLDGPIAFGAVDTVPEPSSDAMLLFATAALLLQRQRRNSRRKSL